MADELARVCAELGVKVPDVELGLDDLFAAYRRVPTAQPEAMVAAIWNFDMTTNITCKNRKASEPACDHLPLECGCSDWLQHGRTLPGYDLQLLLQAAWVCELRHAMDSFFSALWRLFLFARW